MAQLVSVPVSWRLRTTISSGPNLSMTYGECEVTIACPIVLVTKAVIRRCVCGGRGDLGLLHREDHRIGAAQVGAADQQGEHQHVAERLPDGSAQAGALERIIGDPPAHGDTECAGHAGCHHEHSLA